MAADQGPTTVGSIVAKLRMDRDQWARDVAATKAEVREIEGLDPDIHIDDNAGAVITRLQAVKAATDQVDESSERLGRTTRRTTEETIKANEANRTSVTRVGAIVTAVALLVPLLAPVAAGAIGIGGAFLGMGAAGVLALFGIHREMKDGTAVGSAYREGVDDLKGSMDTLARTAAVNMLSSFQRVVKETRDALPSLNTQVGQFSTLLGRSGGNLFSGAINTLRVLNPLFLTAGIYLEQLTAGFQRWSESEGIEEFGGYALSMLPQVTELLGKLATMVMHILQALAPLGVIGMAVLTGIADVITSIPVDVLSQLIVTITWGAVAFKAWGFIAPMLAQIATSMGMVGAATTIATGPIGWVVAGLSALAGIFAVVIANNSGATQAMQDYTYAVQEDTGAIGENVRAKAAQKLADSGALEAAKRLGANLSDVTNATLGQSDALKNLSLYTAAADGDMDAMRKIMDDTGLSQMEVTGLLNTMVKSLRDESAAIDATVDSYNLREESLRTTTDATRAQQSADEAAAAALGISVAAIQEARAGQDDLESSTAKATAEMYVQGDAAGLLKQQLDALNGKALSAAEAQNRFESQLVGMTTAIQNNGSELDGMTEGAIANRGALLDLIQSAQDSAQAFRDQGGSSDETKAKLEASKKAIEDQAVANGMNRDAVHAYIDELFKIPAEIPKTKIEVDTAKANADVAAFLAQVSSRVAWINVRATMPDLNGSTSGSGRPGVAMGGTIRGLAAGGSGGTVMGPGTAGSDTAGLFRLGNGEEVVSNVFGQADRNRGVLKAINAGFTPAQATAGTVRASSSTVTAAPAAQASVVQVDVHVTVLKNDDPAVVGQQVGSGVKQALAGRKL